MLGSERKRKGQEMGHICAQGTHFVAVTGGWLRRTPVLGVGPATNREQGVLCAMACLFPSLSPFASTLPKGLCYALCFTEARWQSGRRTPWFPNFSLASLGVFRVGSGSPVSLCLGWGRSSKNGRFCTFLLWR